MARHEHGKIADVGLLALRATIGGLMAGHGAQKLFGSFGGPGLQGMTGWMDSIGMQPSNVWALLAGGSEFGSGVLTALGLGGPVGQIGLVAPMITAWTKAHADKPIWVTSGGAELPLINITSAVALALVGPGRYSLDELLDIDVPDWVVGVTALSVAAGLVASMVMHNPPQNSAAPPSDEHVPQPDDQPAPPEEPNS